MRELAVVLSSSPTTSALQGANTSTLQLLQLYLIGEGGSPRQMPTTAPEDLQHLATAFRLGACPSLRAVELFYSWWGYQVTDTQVAIEASMVESMQRRGGGRSVRVTFAQIP